MHVAEYSSSDREVVRFLFARQEWADLYELHVEFGLTPGQVIDIVERLVAADFAELDGIKARLTPTGRAWVLEARDAIFRGAGHDSWRPSADELLQTPTGPPSPYLPDLSLVDREFFIKLALDDPHDDATN